ncbi:class I adenylate-forming enzyme family protein [Novosphingobium resinovorum]|uniref:class I adenylate-forming enzyme family protein n=1 Tax=Novosphingobium resinovorum TaxID=158500 RepID=UPI002ECFE203|nr:class I adenylate-forming enzyme family protein [Novosphingobium resinovorum]
MTGSIVTEVSTLGDLLIRAAGMHPERLALVLPAQAISYSDLLGEARKVARMLVAIGVGHGDHVGILIPNSTQYAASLFGISLVGAVAVPLNARHKAAELGYIIRNAEICALLTSRDDSDPVDFPTILREALAGDPTPVLRELVLMRGARDGEFRTPECFEVETAAIDDATVEVLRRRVRVRDAALIIYTSGTTANPKGCVLSHEAITRGPVERSRYRLKAPETDIVWGAGPLFHIGTLAPFVGTVGVAGTFLTDSYFDAGRALDLMATHRVTLAWPWFPAIMQGLMSHPDFDPARLGDLQFLFIIAPPTLVDAVQRALPQTEVIQGCGMTETAGIFALCDVDESFASRSTTNGKACPGVEVRIVDPETGEDVPDGTLGEILVRGYNVMDGYWAAPEKTAEALTPDGWLHTGDLYTRVPGGSLIFGGRQKEMLKVGGENVAAIEIEAFLCTHPAVKTVEIVGRPDLRLDEVPVAFVELEAGMSASEDDLIGHCRGRIASYKVPRAIHFMEASEWPMSATKIDKRALRDRLKQPTL